MTELICGDCGEANDLESTFCAYCHAFLAWDDLGRAVPQAGVAGDRSSPATEQAIETQVMPPAQLTPDSATDQKDLPPTPGGEQDTTKGLFRVWIEDDEVNVPGTGEAATLVLRVANTSTIVDGYVIEAPEAPAWLAVESDQIHLLPKAEEAVQVHLRIRSETPVPAQVLQTTLRLTSTARAPAHADLPIKITVPVVDVPVQLHAEPRLLRVRDTQTAQFAVFADNSRSNRAVQLRFGGSDPELAVRFQFQPPVLELGPGASGSIQVVATAVAPEPGTEVSRALTVSADDGTRSVETVVTLNQVASAPVEDPPIELEAQPSLVRVRDTTVGNLRLIADNRGGQQPAQIHLRASDPESAVRVSWTASELEVPPGKTTYVDALLEAPLPEAGSEVTRTITVTAENGNQTTTTTATFVQEASATPMATLALRIDPNVVRVQDADSATSRVVVDNRRGRTSVQVSLSGIDPERSIRFTFSPSTVEVGPQQAAAVALRMDAWRPQPGQEVTRPFTVSASDGDVAVEASGSLVQACSRAAIETLAVELDPTVLRLGRRRQGMVTAVVDNRKGLQPLRVAMRGDDPENSIRFSFNPNVLDVAPAQLARVAVTLQARGVPGGQELNRPFTVSASDGQTEVVAQGNLVQTSMERRPVARVLFTLLGGLAMIVGGFLPFWSGLRSTAAELNVNRVVQFFAKGNLVTNNQVLAAQIGSVALIMSLFGVVAIFGLTGRTGRLTRVAAFAGFAFLALVFIAFAVGGVNGNIRNGPGLGALLLAAGCVSAYIGGLLARR